jgi:uncharacterized protein (DUF1800 family)
MNRKNSHSNWLFLFFFLLPFSLTLQCFIVNASEINFENDDEISEALAGGTGLRAEYFNNIDLSGKPVLTRNELVVDHDFGIYSPTIVIPVENFSARWSGKIIAPETGTYRFHTLSDDGVRLWINGTQIIDNWTIHNPVLDSSRGIKLTRGQRYDIKLEFFESSQKAVIRLMWTPPRKTQRLIPQAYLLPPGTLPVVSTPTPTPTPLPTTPQSGTLYISEMRPESGVVSSGSGFSTLRLAADERSAIIRFSYGHLTTPLVAAHIHGPANPGTNGPILFDFDDIPQQPDGSYLWTFEQVGHTTIARIVEAIKNGRTYINIHTSRYPNGEIRNHYRKVIGSSTFTPPTSNPPLSTVPRDDKDVARFLTQSTFGPTKTEISRVRQIGFEAWFNEQFDAPTTSHLAYLDNARANGEGIYLNQTMEAFWSKALRGNDQLRQRIAFTMSEIFVLSGFSLDHPYGISGYMDMLQANAFGNFRQTLKNITLNPAMGDFLDMVKNDREDIYSGRVPNENYAREVNQLFSIGLYKLHPDGSLIIDGNGQPIPTYDQETIVGFSYVFTGWGFGGIAATDQNFDYYIPQPDNDYLSYRVPMQPYAYRHSSLPKKLLNNLTLPAGQTAEEDLEMAIDNIFNHPNVGPFLCRQYIQRLVTSNPSSAYVYRVAKVFNDNGSGIRGDMKAVIRAILLDDEARSPIYVTLPGFGKQREPVLRFSALLRAFDARAKSQKYLIWNLQSPIYSLGQNPLLAKTVFNFFEPNYIQPGRLSRAGLISPEFQITNETQIIGSSNQMRDIVFRGFGVDENLIKLNYAEFLPLANSPTQLVEELDLLLMSGQMSTQFKTIVINTISLVPENNIIARVPIAVHLIVDSPQFAIQK